MNKILALFLTLSLVLSLSFSALSKKPGYKAYFNLASDSRYYKYVGYKSSHIFGHTLLLTIIDNRPEQEKTFNEDVQYFYDDIWTEPPASMLGRIFLKELRLSKMFKSVDVDATRPSLILEIELSSLVGHYDRKTTVAKGIVEIHSMFKSASDDRIIINKIYEATSRTDIRRGDIYVPMVQHIGNALHKAMEDMIVDLERAMLSESRK